MSIVSYYKRKKFWLQDFFKGSPMWKEYKDVMSIMQDVESSKSKREAYLRDILLFAKKNTKFYSDVKGDSLSDFHVVDKQTIVNSYSDFIVPAERIPGQVGPVHVQKTSGSTGTPFQVYQDTRCRTRRIATIKACNELIGFHSFERLMHLRSIKHFWNFPGDIKWVPELEILYADNANLTDEKVSIIIDAINDYKIQYVRGYMTTLDTITRYSVEHNKPLVTKPTFISGGEILLESFRERVVAMGCKVISQYANEENGVLGQSEINGGGTTMILNRANCIVEILKMDSDEPAEDDELGRVVVTDFTNHAMPMIRYDIGDVAMRGDVASNGELLSIKNLVGRKTDMIIRTDGAAIDFFNSIPTSIYYGSKIKQWQFIQKDATTYLLKICASDSSVKSEESNLIQEMKDVLGQDADITIKYLDEIPVLSSGKRKIIIQEYQK